MIPDVMLNFLAHGLLDWPIWKIVLTVLAMTHVTIAAVTIYYSGFTLLVLAGIWRIGRRLLTPRYAAAVALLLSLFAVHTFYWSNLRMRAPAVPALAIFAAIGLCRSRLPDETAPSSSTDKSNSPDTAI